MFRGASKMALKTVVSLIRHDCVKCNDDVRQISGVCSSWLRGKDPSMTLGCFKSMCTIEVLWHRFGRQARIGCALV